MDTNGGNAETRPGLAISQFALETVGVAIPRANPA